MGTTPTITGPVEGGRRGIAFCRPRTDVKARGYVVEEFILDGEATSYVTAPGATHGKEGKWDAVEDETKPYRTRILVVRPRNAEDFDGTVVCNWQNVTAGYELGSADDSGTLDGSAWVGVSAQAVGIHGFPGNRNAMGQELEVQWHLTAWEPERYGTLQHPGDDWSYDIFSQAAAAVGPRRPTSGIDPMGGLPVKRVIAAGASQSGGRLTTYYNAVHPLARTFDGFLPSISGAFATPVNSKEAAATEPATPMMGRLGARYRDDLDTPLFLVNSECEARGYHPNRRPDDATFRFWEIAGTPHDNRMAPGKAEGGEGRILNPLTYQPFQAMALQHLVRWIDDPAALPPIFAGMDKTIDDEGRAHLVRDEHGNAKGDLRHPALDAPTAEYHGANGQGPGFGRLFGWALPHDPAAVKERFGSEAAYLERYAAAVDDLIERQAIRAIDRDQLIAAAPPYPA